MVVVCAVAAKLASQRDRRRQRARGAVVQSQQPCSDGKRPECHEIWLSPASSDSQWQSMLVGLHRRLLHTDEPIAFLYPANICRNLPTYPVCSFAGQIARPLVIGERPSSQSTSSHASELPISINDLAPALRLAKSPPSL